MIKVGEYIRTQNGKIRKVKTIHKGKRPTAITSECLINGKFKIEDIVNYSKNIIDLIEIGDVLKFKEDNSIFYIGLEKDEITITYQEIIDDIKNNKIELLAILTKEQIKKVEYRIIPEEK